VELEALLLRRIYISQAEHSADHRLTRVTTLSDLRTAVKGTSAKIVKISGIITGGNIAQNQYSNACSLGSLLTRWRCS
jgi:hypothetical protein